MKLLEATSISKSFGETRALRGVSFELLAGEVHALAGENGAGKSTLIKIITGAIAADAGTLAIGGCVVERNDPALAHSLGVAAIYQQPVLFPHLSVAENIALALERGSGWRRVDRKERNRRARELIAQTGAEIAPQRLASTLTMPEQQIVEIAKAIGADAKILIMDEPTASLSERETERLLATIAGLRECGAGIIYISHRLEEIEAIADRVTVLRDGQTVATRRRGEMDRGALIAMMVGREISAVLAKRETAAGAVAMEVRELSNEATGLRDISFSLRAGEILGFAGLVGSGRTELAETLFGISPASSGEIAIGGRRVRIASPEQAIQAGVGYVPEDRRRHGVILEMPVAANTSLAKLSAVSLGGLIDGAAERELAARYVRELRIKTPSVYAVAGALSGGNQQKVALARWLAIAPKVLILDEPTQGVDVGSKAEIHALIGELASRGMAILLISSEMEEILAICDRTAVMQEGSIRGILTRAEATAEKILALALGHVA